MHAKRNKKEKCAHHKKYVPYVDTKGKRKLNRSTAHEKSEIHLYGDQLLDFFNLFILWLFMCAALRPKPKQKQYWSFLGILWRRNDKQYTPKRMGSQFLFKNPYEKNKSAYPLFLRDGLHLVFCTCVKRILCVITASMASCSWDCVHVGTCQAPSILILSNSLKEKN